jgi:transposase-like protein
MADELRIGLQELLRKAQVEGDASFLKEGVRALSQAIMEMEVEDHIGAARHERGPGRTGQRNGYSSSRADGPSGRFRRWCRKPTSTGSLPARSTSW